MRTLLVIGAVVVSTLPSDQASTPPGPDPMRDVAERYVKLVLAVGQHDADYVDAYYGPPEWRTAAEQQKVPLAELDQRAAALEKDAAAAPAAAKSPDAELWSLRRQYLARQLAALRTRVAM